MNALLDKLIIATLAGCVAWLLFEKYKRQAVTVENPKDRDLFNMKEFPQRKEETNRITRLEKRA